MKPKSAPDPHLQKNFQIKIPPPLLLLARFFTKQTNNQIQKI